MRKLYVALIGGIFGVLFLSSAVIPIVFYQPIGWTSYTEPGICTAEERFGLFSTWVSLEASLWEFIEVVTPTRYSLAVKISRIYCYMSIKRVWIIDGDSIYSTGPSKEKSFENYEFTMIWRNYPALSPHADVSVVVKIWIQWEIHYLIDRDCPIHMIS